MSRIFWDTNIFVYLIEDYPVLSTHAFELRERMLERNDQLFTSTMTLGELLIKPLEVGDKDGVLKYQTLLTTGTVLIPFEQRAAVRYAEIRQDRSIRPPDAIQLACASTADIDLFITNDERLSQKNVPGIQFLVSFDSAFL